MTTVVDLDASKFIAVSMEATARTLDELQAEWVSGFEGTTTGYPAASGDDGATLINVPPIWPNGATQAVYSWECGVELVPYPFGGTPAFYSAGIPGVSRYYSMNVGLRVAIIYHPTGVDSGLTSFVGSYDAGLSVFRAKHNRTGENVEVVARLVRGRQLEIAIKNSVQAAGLPIKVAVLNGTTVASVVDIASIALGAVGLVTCSIYGGTVSGTVVDQAGEPATRIVRAHERSSGAVLGETRSNASGQYELPVIAKVGTTMYLIALDDETPPLINAVVADRIVLE
ncbi:hypothetical protein MMK57_003734 [Pseudomonas aeruginosa]|uniref:hypothetical protein n=1 Tax=Pseudomonas aeruginosa TaxID=287 RepID=UPI00071B7737|nr:hypothetical protein [Pseudomonas aeruginosa]ASA16423.1 hypothetical protein CDL16_20515 [Pseudomonas aeruginosa]EIY2512818.1 hypothetical protein [Pseudomonas aeruginosa]EIY2820106.1 hypothetical protein [Pseudomonas aeruginosa]EKU2957257.1 hypothetical protein [Pseudomonas aeruginosa]KSF19996.1 hypothetical protein AO935_15295 [Pseudomonas aeruginosa]